MLLSRTDRSYFSEWWWTVDRLALLTCVILMVVGLVLSLAASPAVATRIGVDEMFFVKKQLKFIPLGLFLMFSISFITSERLLRSIALILFVGGAALMVVAIVSGASIKGSNRWLSLGFMTLQPSEVVKPGFVVLSAWLFAQGIKYPNVKGGWLSLVLFLSFASLLVLQPDMGQTVLVTAVWFCLFILSGAPLWIFAVLTSVFAAGAFFAYNTMSHVASRIDRFLDPASGDTYQMDMALQSFMQGGWFGKGPGESSVKSLLPDAHTDFVFAVVGEEFGIIGALLIISVYVLMIFSFLRHAFVIEDMFKKLAITGLTVMFGMQAFINMGVNLNILPAKGMTLPFISSGGSSLLSMSITIGLLLALTRRQPQANHLPVGGRFQSPLQGV